LVHARFLMTGFAVCQGGYSSRANASAKLNPRERTH
jgi:hypothetical protein